MEEWKIVAECPTYSVSSFGRIKNNNTNKIIKLHTDKDGYKDIGFSNGNRKSRLYRRIHRIVALAFIPNPDNLPLVNHIDGVKDNNHVDNLEWVTLSRNVTHSYEIELNKNLVPLIVKDIKTNKVYSFRSLKFFTNVFCNQIINVSTVLCLAKSSHIRPILGRFTIVSIDTERLLNTKNVENQRQKIYVYDCIFNKFYIFKSINYARYFTEIRAIEFGKNKTTIERCGYIFSKQYYGIKRIKRKKLTDAEKEKCLQLRQHYILQPHSYLPSIYYILNYKTKNVYFLKDYNTGCKILENKIKPNILERIVCKSSKFDKVVFCHGFGISKTLPKKWPEYRYKQIST